MDKIWFVLTLTVLASREKLLVAPAPTTSASIGTAFIDMAAAATALPTPSPAQINLQITNRTAWHAAPPRKVTPINGIAGSGLMAVPYVIIHHTATPGACDTTTACKAVLKSVQRTHQVDQGWDDIGYNFLIGGSSNGFTEIYEGRGFGVSGAHAGAAYNSKSVGICFIGDWSDAQPPSPMLEKLQQLINYGIQGGYIQKNYKLIGHRQVRATLCPGDKLFNVIKQWDHFTQHPN